MLQPKPPLSTLGEGPEGLPREKIKGGELKNTADRSMAEVLGHWGNM